jgi:tetratricopeptide (TPR) repeat protein
MLVLTLASASACGPWFPNTLLDGGDAAKLTAPKASFHGELERMKLATPAFHAVLATNSYPEQTCDTDLAELRSALLRAQVDDTRRGETIAAYSVERLRLRHAAEAVEAWENSGELDWSSTPPKRQRTEPRPTLADWPKMPAGLPPEFASYFTGSVAWHAGLTNAARTDWENLLQLPAAQRHFRSTWAAYMLGRAWHDEDPDRANGYYQQVRALAKDGFADSLGLAAASLGWEAQLLWREKHHEEAIELYVDQLATGDGSAVNSLHFVAGQACKLGPPVMQALATNPRTRQVITAFVISTSDFELPELPAEDSTTDSDRRLNPVAADWLDAVEAANVRDVESAEQMALLAYQWGQWDVAQRWINRARSTPTAQWLEAKLLLRAGRVDEAAATLSGLTRQFPLAPRSTNSPSPHGLADTLRVEGYEFGNGDSKTAAQQVWGEFGTFCLARRDYTEALDALLRADFWTDAAYVAERVLTAGELQTYVDQNWPAPTRKPSFTEEEVYPEPTEPASEIRYLLARRLARLGRYAEARGYYPEEWQAACDELSANLQRGADENLSAAERAQALFAAAGMTRTNGLELIGTEVEPDWHLHGGDFEVGVTIGSRSGTSETNHLQASEEELQRARAHGVTPSVRWHYRDRAAMLGLQAAQLSQEDFSAMSKIILASRAWVQDAVVAEEFYRAVIALGWQAIKGLPDNADETARVLCTAGSWIKYWSPREADVFYKALVRRCGQTALGRQADLMRWFPRLDENGNPIPWHPRPPTEVPLIDPAPASPDDLSQAPHNTPTPPPLAPDSLTPAPPPDAAGFCYVLHRGNSLQDVADAVRSEHSLEVSVEEIRAANPAVNPAKLKPGLKIFVPLPLGTDGSPEALMDLLFPPVEPPGARRSVDAGSSPSSPAPTAK